MDKIRERLNAHKSTVASRWREKALARQADKEWLQYSKRIAMMMLDKMDELGITQTAVAARMGCTQQYISRVLKGNVNLSIETITKIEAALDIQILEPVLAIR
ncbi:MAG: helix-turn-helix transcriptional regulator [Muribaculaceae bacterium]|nr:helix-turn-helix transcriptional regulator [Muribaculaceae bacterium]